MRFLKINHINSFQLFQVLKYSSQIIINIVLAKTYLSLSDLGKFETFLFIATSVSFFWVTGIMQFLLSYYPSNTKPEKTRDTIFTSISFLLVLLSTISIMLLSGYIVINPINLSTYEICMLFIYMLLNPVSFIAEHILLLKKQFKKLIIFGIITFIVPPLIVSLPAFIEAPLIFCFYGLISWSVIKTVFLVILLYRYSLLKVNIKEVFNLFVKSAPLILSALLVGSASYIDGFIISGYFDTETFAIFRYGAREFPLFLIIASSFSSSMVPLIAGKEKINEKLELIKKESRQMIHIYFPMAAVLLLSSQFIFPIVFNQNFSNSYKVFDIYLLLIISRFMFPQSILLGFQKNNTILLVSVAELLVNISVSLVFIRYLGYIGVAFGTVIAYFFEKIFLIVLTNKQLHIPVKKYISIQSLALGGILMCLIYILKVFL